MFNTYKFNPILCFNCALQGMQNNTKMCRKTNTWKAFKLNICNVYLLHCRPYWNLVCCSRVTKNLFQIKSQSSNSGSPAMQVRPKVRRIKKLFSSSTLWTNSFGELINTFRVHSKINTGEIFLPKDPQPLERFEDLTSNERLCNLHGLKWLCTCNNQNSHSNPKTETNMLFRLVLHTEQLSQMPERNRDVTWDSAPILKWG